MTVEPQPPLEAHVAAVSDQLALSQLIIENAADAIFLLDDQGRATFANPAAEEMFGWSAAELQGKKLHEVVHYQYADGTPFPMEACALGKVFSGGSTLRSHEDTFFRKDGSPVPITCSIAAVTRDGGVVGGVLIVRDTGEKRRAEEHRQLLLNELNHRVKNTLAIVQSIAHQTMKGTDVEAIRSSFDGRLAALSAAHNLLTDSNWTSTSLDEVVRAAVSPFCGGRDRCTVEGPSIEISPKAAVALALAIHELATNATKYGALSNDVGKINVRWRLAPRDDEFELVWKEEGGPAVIQPSRRGFGSRLIQRGLASELSAAVDMEYAPAGLICSVRCASSELN